MVTVGISTGVTGAPGTDGLSLSLRTDTRFQTTPSVLKYLLGVGVLVGLAGMVAGAWRRDGRAFSRPRRPRLRPVDAQRVPGHFQLRLTPSLTIGCDVVYREQSDIGVTFVAH